MTLIEIERLVKGLQKYELLIPLLKKILVCETVGNLEEFKEKELGAAAERYFLEQKAQFDQVIYSVLRVAEPGLAQELYFRIAEGEASFSDMARQFSQGIEANTGGLIGPVPIGRIQPELARLLHQLNVAELSPPFRLGSTWFLVRLEKHLPAQFDRLRPQIIDRLFDEWLQNQINQLIQDNKVHELLLQYI